VIEDLKKLFSILANELRVIGFRYLGNSVAYGTIESFDEIPTKVTDIQRAASYTLIKKEGVNYFRHNYYSPKYYLHPPDTIVFMVNSKNIVTMQIPEDEGIALFGIKPCDLYSIKVLDGILKDRDPIYTKRRENIKFVLVEECIEPSDVCFCGSIGSGPDAKQDFDLAYARLSEEEVIFKVGSNKGEEIVSKLNLVEASENIVKVYKDAIEKARIKTMAIDNINKSMEALKRSITDKDLWKELSSKCIGCANCNLVCPTCFCTEFYDEIDDEDNAIRGRKWIGCNSYVYGQVAGMHFRPEQYMRYRHFILHKFVFYPMQIGLIGCVGCGRCITWCPMAIDIRETLKKVTAKYT